MPSSVRSTPVVSGFGFAAPRDSGSLRRQWAMSLAVVAGLAVAIVSAVVNIGTLPSTVESRGVMIAVPSMHADTDVAGATRS